jgi:hypothetical protein
MADKSNAKKPRRESRPRSDGELGGISPHFVPPDATIAELERRAADCGQRAAKAEEPQAAELRQEAMLYRGWIAALRLGCWTS